MKRALVAAIIAVLLVVSGVNAHHRPDHPKGPRPSPTPVTTPTPAPTPTPTLSPVPPTPTPVTPSPSPTRTPAPTPSPTATSAPSSGTSFTYECADPSGPPVTFCDVLGNPDIHNGSKGTIWAHSTSGGKRTIPMPSSARIAVVSGAAVSGGTNTSVIVQHADPSVCRDGWSLMGYQSWWSDTGQDPYFGSRHIHFDNFCLPLNNKIISGTQTFTFWLQIHAQPAGARVTRVRLKDQPTGNDLWWTTTRCSSTITHTCLPTLDSNGNAIVPFTVTRDMSSWPSGRREWQWAAYVLQPDGQTVQLLSTRAEVCKDTCSPAYRSGTYQGNGSWYEKDTDPGYVDSRIHTALPAS